MITQDEAITILNQLLFVAQKMRSNARESTRSAGVSEENVDRVLADLMPEIFADDPKRVNLVDAFRRYADGAEQKGYVEPGDFYNALYLARKSDVIWGGYNLVQRRDLPEPRAAYTELEKPLAVR